MPVLEIIFFILLGFYIGLFAGIFLAYKLKQWKEEDRILAEDVGKWMKEQNNLLMICFENINIINIFIVINEQFKHRIIPSIRI